MAKTAQEILGMQLPDVTKAQQTVLGLNPSEKRQFLTTSGIAVRSLSDTQLDPLVNQFFKNLGENVRKASFSQKELRRLTGVEPGFATGDTGQINFQIQEFQDALQNIEGFQKALPQQARSTAPVDFSKIDVAESGQTTVGEQQSSIPPPAATQAPVQGIPQQAALPTSNDFAQAFKTQFGRSPTNDELISFTNQRKTKPMADILAGFATTPAVGGAQLTDQAQVSEASIPFGGSLSPDQKQGIVNLVNSGRAFNETDAKNFAFATGKGGDFQQFVGKTGMQALGLSRPSTALAERVGDISQSVQAEDIAKSPVSSTGMFSTATPTTGQQLAKIADTTLSGLDQALFSLQAQKEERAQQNLAIKEQEQTITQENLTDELLSNARSRALSTALDQFNIEAKQKALTDIKLQIAQEQAKISLGKVEIGAEIAPISFISRAQAELEARAAARIGALAASASVLQDDLDTALQLASLTVDTLNQDKEDRIKAYEFLFDLADRDVVKLEAEERKAAEEQIAVLKDAKQKAEENKNAVAALIADNPVAASKSGVLLTDDPTLAAQKISSYLASVPAEPELRSIGSDLYQVSFNPATGKYSAQLVQAAPKKGSGGGASSGQTAIVTTSDGRAVELSQTAKDIFENPALLQNFTPTERGNILREISNAGLGLDQFAIEDLQAGQRDTIAQYDDLIRQGESAETLLDETGLKTGPIASKILAGKALLGGAQDFTSYRGIIDNMSSALLKLRSGAAVTPQEFERIRGFVPSPNDNEKTAKTKIKNFYEELDVARANYVKRSTQTEQQILDSAIQQDKSNLRTKYGY